jgi:hypothetical protein
MPATSPMERLGVITPNFSKQERNSVGVNYGNFVSNEREYRANE